MKRIVIAYQMRYHCMLTHRGGTMIKLTKLNNDKIYINEILIEFIEETPDTVITLTTGKKIIVKETVEVVINEIIEYQKRVN